MKRFYSRTLTYEKFQSTTDRFALHLVLKAKSSYPFANDLAFTSGLLNTGLQIFFHTPEDGLGKYAIEMFDTSYKLGLPLRPTLISILRNILKEKYNLRNHEVIVKHKSVLKRWGRVPLPWISHTERYEDDKLVAKTYRNRSGIRVESMVPIRIESPYESSLVDDPSIRTLWKFLVSVYASRKLDILFKHYMSGEEPLKLVHSTTADIVEEIKEVNPVAATILKIERIQWNGTQNSLAALLVVLKRNDWILDYRPYNTIKAAFTKTDTIDTILRPDKEDGEPQYGSIPKKNFEFFKGIKKKS